MVLAGSIDRRGDGYEISVKAIKTVTGEVVADTRRRASNKDQVPDAATRLVATVRRALGDETSDSAQLLAMRSLSTTSMEVAANYAAALAAQSNGQPEEARQRYQKTVELEPDFGLGYQGLAIMSRNLGRLQDAQKFSLEALNHLAGDDRARAACRSRLLLLEYRRLSAVRERVQRADRPIRRGRVRPLQPRGVPVEIAEYA